MYIEDTVSSEGRREKRERKISKIVDVRARATSRILHVSTVTS